MPKARWVMSSGFCIKFHTLSSSLELTKLQTVKRWELFETQCSYILGSDSMFTRTLLVS